MRHCSDTYNEAQWTSGYLPKGLGYKVGPETGVDVLVYCSHTHLHHEEQLRVTNRSSVAFEMVPVSSAPDLQEAAVFLFGEDEHLNEQYAGGALMQANHTFNESVSMCPYQIHYHVHCNKYKSESVTMRLEKKDGAATVIGDISLHGQVNHVQSLSRCVPIEVGDVIKIECKFIVQSSEFVLEQTKK